MAGRLDRAKSDDQSCTDRSCSGADVGLATIPETTTFALGVAMVGLSEVIAIHGCARVPGWLAAAVRAAPAPVPGAAAAGTAASHPAPSAAARAASRRHRRAPWPAPGKGAGAGLARPLTRHAEMLLPIVGCRLRPAIITRGRAGGAAATAPAPAPGTAGAGPFPIGGREPYPHGVPDSSDLTPDQRRAAADLLRGKWRR